MRKSLFHKLTQLAASSNIEVWLGLLDLRNFKNLVNLKSFQIANQKSLCVILKILILLVFTPLSMSAQKLTYYDNIEPIIQKNCVSCHRKGQIAPFTLTSYEDVERRAGFIKKVTAQRYMPPNPADPSVSHFKNVKRLTQEEIATIGKWVEQGKVKGKEKKNRQGSVKEDTISWREPDLVLTFNEPYQIKGDNREHFKVFVVPTNATEDLYVSGIDFFPQNKQLAHHCRFMIDTTNLLRPDNGIEVGDKSEFQRLGVRMNDNFWHGWIPGNTAIFYPDNTAKRLPKGSDIVLNMHYSPSPKDVTEQSKILIYLSKQPAKRLVKTFILEENSVVNEPFMIPKDSVIKFYQRSPVIPYDISLISITPHMHLLGKNFKAYAITPEGDLINLIKIDSWDFSWQMTYQFDKLLKIPKGSVIYSEAEYDNTPKNGRNPYDPPRDVTYGWGTKDEMLNLIFQYLDYEIGDERK
ncbi:MAG: hypothetical protein JNL70_06420 [Saprospiraceae bacterium]|nr:hypothetical protein [Saprospiraceae bacterium]